MIVEIYQSEINISYSETSDKKYSMENQIEK